MAQHDDEQDRLMRTIGWVAVVVIVLAGLVLAGLLYHTFEAIDFGVGRP